MKDEQTRDRSGSMIEEHGFQPTSLDKSEEKVDNNNSPKVSPEIVRLFARSMMNHGKGRGCCCQCSCRYWPATLIESHA